MVLPNLFALAPTGCATCEEEHRSKRARTHDAEKKKKDLVLVLGGTPMRSLVITTINRMYARLADNLRTSQDAVDVVVIDPHEFPGPWQDGVTVHYKMELQEFDTEHPIGPFLDQYDRVAVVDDLQFLGDTRFFHGERASIERSDAYKALRDYAEANKGRVAWWEFVQNYTTRATRGSDGQTRGMREMNTLPMNGHPDKGRIPMDNARLLWDVAGGRLLRLGYAHYLEFGEVPAPDNLLEQLLLRDT